MSVQHQYVFSFWVCILAHKVFKEHLSALFCNKLQSVHIVSPYFFPTNSLFPTSSRTSVLTEFYIMFATIFFVVQNTACESFAVCFSNLALITNLLIFYLLFFHGTYYCRSHNGNQNLSFVFVWKLEKYFSSKSVFPIETKFQNYILEELMQMRVYVCICMQFCM